jgi:3-phenylpropionate/trans-cinnamate dioxygenase ferredoxin subunit
MPADPFVRAVPVHELRPGRVTVTLLDGQRIAITSVGEQIVAFKDSCPHAGSSFAAGRLIGDRLICPFHGAKFDARSGACVNAPYSPLTRFLTRIVDGFVEVDVTSAH